MRVRGCGVIGAVHESEGVGSKVFWRREMEMRWGGGYLELIYVCYKNWLHFWCESSNFYLY